MTDRPLFQSAHNALMFAFTHTANQHAVAAAAERAIALSARERYRELRARTESRGLVGVDGAAQAGMILARVERVLTLQQLVLIVARFAVLHPHLREAGMRGVALQARRELRRMMLADRHAAFERALILVRRHYGAATRLAALADRADTPERTLQRQAMDIARFVRRAEQVAMDRLERDFERANWCEAIDEIRPIAQKSCTLAESASECVSSR